jgi:translation elongation factor EF-Tu-like GTPase
LVVTEQNAHPANSYPRDVEAQIVFLSTEEGGKRNPVKTGYRCQFRYDGQDWFGLQTFPGKEQVYPGETVNAYVTFLSPEDHKGKLLVGKAFQLVEGSHIVANGVVTRIIELETRKSARLEPPSWLYPD